MTDEEIQRIRDRLRKFDIAYSTIEYDPHTPIGMSIQLIMDARDVVEYLYNADK